MRSGGGGGPSHEACVMCVCRGTSEPWGMGGGVASKSWGMCMVGGQRGMSSLLPLLPEF